MPELTRHAKTDADADGIPDVSDPLPFTPGTVSWKVDPRQDGLPTLQPPFADGVRAFNFTAANGLQPNGFINDIGAPFSADRGFGWRNDLSRNTRLRKSDHDPLRAGFVFTRGKDIWECEVPNGRWKVSVCLGDSEHPQPGQHLAINDQVIVANVETAAGTFHEAVETVDITGGRIIVTMGVSKGGSNTCLNWIILEPRPRTAAVFKQPPLSG